MNLRNTNFLPADGNQRFQIAHVMALDHWHVAVHGLWLFGGGKSSHDRLCRHPILSFGDYYLPYQRTKHDQSGRHVCARSGLENSSGFYRLGTLAGEQTTIPRRGPRPFCWFQPVFLVIFTLSASLTLSQMEKHGGNRLYFLSMAATYFLSALCVVVVMMRHWRSSEIFYVREQE